MIFVTGNNGKFEEAARAIPGIRRAVMDVPEIQAESLEEIARFSVEYAHEALGKPCFVEDAGFFVDALNGFPGPYTKYVLGAIGTDGLLKLMEGVEGRKARFEACIAYHDGEKIRAFSGRVGGTVSLSARGKQGFGFDPVFVPEGREKTFAEDYEHKQLVSHRRAALEKFRAFVAKPL